jgi:hypothetical protein
MSAARIVHFGHDECHRLDVLRQAGYEATLCLSEPELVQQVEAVAPVAVLFPRVPAKPQNIRELRNRTDIPFVVFTGSMRMAEAGSFDLVIEPVTRPEEWLERLAGVIQLSRELRKSSQLIFSQARQLRDASESLRRESEAARRKSADAQQKLRNTRRKLTITDK